MKLNLLDKRVATETYPITNKRIAAYFGFDVLEEAIELKESIETYLPVEARQIEVGESEKLPTNYECKIAGATTKLVLSICGRFDVSIDGSETW